MATLKLEHRPEEIAPQIAQPTNVAAAIIREAVTDYRSYEIEPYLSADRFLYPQMPDWQEHFAKIVGLSGINPAWLREMLDLRRAEWDDERQGRHARRREIQNTNRRRRAA